MSSAEKGPACLSCNDATDPDEMCGYCLLSHHGEAIGEELAKLYKEELGESYVADPGEREYAMEIVRNVGLAMVNDLLVGNASEELYRAIEYASRPAKGAAAADAAKLAPSMSAEEEFHSSVCEVLMGVERGADVDVETGGTAPGCPWCDQALPEDPQMEDHLEDCKLAALLWEARHQLKGMRE